MSRLFGVAVLLAGLVPASVQAAERRTAVVEAVEGRDQGTLQVGI